MELQNTTSVLLTQHCSPTDTINHILWWHHINTLTKQNHLHKHGNKVRVMGIFFFSFFLLTMKIWDRRPAHAPTCPCCLRDGGLLRRRGDDGGDDGQTSRRQRGRRDGQDDAWNVLLISSMKNVHKPSKSAVQCACHLYSTTTTTMASLGYFYISVMHVFLMGKY